ncbi:hypothetical protein OOU_Y34scaffold00378g6 [Pyricularia oryzae Y34]|uniref:Uncharacterized protein n=3 Tax=Pyricularia oryzae TaxID=318829 RepID=Q2KGP1_PYRO7|nr:hypothetical protein MGCH7_ch7g294 [Pyricularia oryzae 70-15]ELQ40694.1 hypothetical protein OOU_Y34scaffold00378g6 [Pyricularia oryzae Y34]
MSARWTARVVVSIAGSAQRCAYSTRLNDVHIRILNSQGCSGTGLIVR